MRHTGFTRNESGRSQRLGAEFGLSHAFVTGGALAEAGGWLRHETLRLGGAYDQWQAGGALTLATAGGVRFDFGLGVGEKVPNHIAMRERLMLGAATHSGKRPVQAVLTVEQRRGGAFLGTSRDELAISLALRRSFEVTFGGRDITASIGITATKMKARHALLEQQGVALDTSFSF